jgi:ETC complex I subunit-like protein
MMASTVVSGIGHNARPLPPVGHPIWPDGAGVVIARRKRPVATSGQARTGEWVLRFERRTPPFIEPLMGWTGGDDTLVQVELTFRSRDEAIAYAERQGFLFRVVNDPATLTKAWPEHRPPAAEERRAGAAMPARSFPRPMRPRPSPRPCRRRETGRPGREAPEMGGWSNLA